MDTMIDAASRSDDARRGADGSGLDEVAVGTGASIVVVVAATLAVMLAVLVASLGSVVAAPREPAVATVAAADTAARPSTPIALALLGVSAPPVRDGLYHLPAPKPEKSLAVALVGGLFLAMTGAAGMAWSAAIGSALGGRGRRVPPTHRQPPVRVSHPYHGSGHPAAGRGEPRPTR